MLTRIKSAFTDLVEAQKANVQQKEGLREYRLALLQMLSDMRLDPHEVSELRGLQLGQSLSLQSIRRIHRQVLIDLVRQVFADGVVTEEEFEGVTQVGTALGLQLQDLPPDLFLAVNVAGAVIRIQQGRLPELPPEQRSLIARPDEVVHAETAAWRLDERTEALFVRRATQGTTTLRQELAESEIVAVDTGIFAVSDQRLVYGGQRQPFSAEWPGVHRLRPLRDGVLLTASSAGGTVLLKYADAAAGDVLMALLTHYAERAR